MTDAPPNPRSSHRSLIIGILAVGLLLRLAPLGRYVTPDEPAWVYRAIRFADALSARDWAAIPSTGHPGVTTMWLGAAGVTVQRLLSPSGSDAHLDWIRRMAWLTPENGEAFRHLTPFLPWGRVAVALVTTLGLATLYPLLVRLFDRRVALLTVGLLTFDPFIIGHSGLLHTDALLTTFSLLALATGLNGLREPRRVVWWALSGLFTGLAMLTKTPALILLPFIPLLITIGHLRKSQIANWPSSIVRCALHCSSFILLTILTLFALYPALWANPANTLHTLSSFAGRRVEMAQRPIFFAGQMTYDPGPVFYPAVFLLRISPIVLIGLAAGLTTLRRLPPERRLAFLLLIAFAIGFGALMSLGAKKHDRYLLPTFPPLTIAAALGISASAANLPPSLPGRGGRKVRLGRPTNLLIALIVLQALSALPFTFYPLTAFNPLAGGPWVAARVLPTDWGEGMGAAARRLNQQPDAGSITVAALSVPSFASLFDGHTVPLDQATLADYLVVSPAWSTDLPVDRPAHIIKLCLLDHAIILTNTAPAEQSAYLAAHAGPNDLILLDADAPLLRRYTGPGVIASTAGLPDRAAVAVRLAELIEPRTDRSNIWLVADPAAAPITAAHLRQILETIATPVSTVTIASAAITQYTIHNTPHVPRFTHRATFGNHLILIDTLLPTTPVNAPFPISLRWQVPAPTSADLHASIQLRDPAGRLWAEVGQPVLDDIAFPTSSWTPGEWTDNLLTLKPPERIPPGDYSAQLTVSDSAGAQLGAWDADGQFRGVRVPLGDVEITPPAEPAGPAPCDDGHIVTAGPLMVCIPGGPTEPTTALPSGDALTLALDWSAIAPPETDYRVRWRLLDITDHVALERTISLSPYVTSRWRADDSFEVRYDLRLDPLLPAATYTLALNVIAPDGSPLWATDEPLTTVEILPRDRLFELPGDIGHPLDLTLGGSVHLRGFDLDRTQTTPGDALSLTLYWQGDGPTDLDYTVFVHLLGPDGRPHGQVDRFPGGGAAPTTSWAPGQVIVDALSLPVADDAPAGDYHIAVGLYDVASGGRLPVTDASGNLLPDDQTILPVAVTLSP